MLHVQIRQAQTLLSGYGAGVHVAVIASDVHNIIGVRDSRRRHPGVYNLCLKL